MKIESCRRMLGKIKEQQTKSQIDVGRIKYKSMRFFNKMNLKYQSIKKSVEIQQKEKKNTMKGKKIDFPIMKNNVQTKVNV